MTQEELWEIYTRRNPSFETQGAMLTANGIRKLFDQTWEVAYEQGVKDGKCIHGAKVDSDFPDVLREFLGR